MKHIILPSIVVLALCIGTAEAQSPDASRGDDGNSKRTTARVAGADPRETYSTNGWNLVWNDEFDYADPQGHLANWIQEEGFIRGKEPQFYTTNRVENLRVEDGCLVFTVRKEPWPNPDFGKPSHYSMRRETKEARYTSASVESRRSFLYGRIEFRAQLPNGQGAWPALWFLGETWRKPRDDPGYRRWPLCGEIDLVEVWGHDPNLVQTCCHTARRGPKPGEADYSPRNFHVVVGGEQFHDCGPGQEPWNGFHTYTLDWYEDRLFMFYDGILFGKVDLSQADRPEGGNSFREPMFAIMNIALGGGGADKRNFVFDKDTVLEDGTTIPAATFPMVMKIDWVRHFAPPPNP